MGSDACWGETSQPANHFEMYSQKNTSEKKAHSLMKRDLFLQKLVMILLHALTQILGDISFVNLRE